MLTILSLLVTGAIGVGFTVPIYEFIRTRRQWHHWQNELIKAIILTIPAIYFLTAALHLGYIFFVERQNVDVSGLVEVLRMSFPVEHIPAGEIDCTDSFDKRCFRN